MWTVWIFRFVAGQRDTKSIETFANKIQIYSSKTQKFLHFSEVAA